MKISKSTTLAEIETILTEMSASMEIDHPTLELPFTVIIYSRAKGAPAAAFKSKQTRATHKSLPTAIRNALAAHRAYVE